MKTLERNSGRAWLDWLLNAWPFCLDTESIATLFVVARDAEGWYKPGDRSLFYNGYFFLRITWPFGVWLHLKWRSDSRFQCGIGWKLNGRIAITFRYQTDAAAAQGVTGPNLGQAGAWDRGTA